MTANVCAGACAEPPNVELPAPEPVCTCGAAWCALADRRGVWRCAAGHPRPGTPGPALQHGGRSLLARRGALPIQAEAVALLAERQAAILADKGGPENVGHLTAGLVRRYLEVGLIADYLVANFIHEGVLTAKGRTRAAVLTYLKTVDRLERLARTIGLERVAKQVPTLTDYLARREAPTDAHHGPLGAPTAADPSPGTLVPDRPASASQDRPDEGSTQDRNHNDGGKHGLVEPREEERRRDDDAADSDRTP